MSILSTLTTDKAIKEDSDFLGGFQALESDLYNLTIKHAYITAAPSEALALNVVFTSEDSRELRQQFWMRSGKAKGCKNFYLNKKGEKHYLPGFNQANALCLLTVAKEISTLDTEQKVIPLYNRDEQKEVPTKVDMLTDLLGKQITAGVIKQLVDKNEKDPNSGEYVPTGETRTENEVDKFFRFRDGLTVTEIRGKMATPEFKNKWLDKWQGEIKDKSTGTAGVIAGAPIAAKRETGKQAPKESLFA